MLQCHHKAVTQKVVRFIMHHISAASSMAKREGKARHLSTVPAIYQASATLGTASRTSIIASNGFLANFSLQLSLGRFEHPNLGSKTATGNPARRTGGWCGNASRSLRFPKQSRIRLQPKFQWKASLAQHGHESLRVYATWTSGSSHKMKKRNHSLKFLFIEFRHQDT